MSRIIFLIIFGLGLLCPFSAASKPDRVLDFNELSEHTISNRGRLPQPRIQNKYEHPYWDTFGVFDGASCKIDRKLQKEIKGYKDIVDQIMDKIVAGNFKGETFKHLAHFTDNFGSRLVTSPQYARAASFLTRQLLNIETLAGRVFVEDVVVPNWKRIKESAEIVSPIQKPLAIMGMGLTVPTYLNGIEAEVIVVDSLEELRLNKLNIGGRILVFNLSFQETQSVILTAASRGALLGAVAVLVKSPAPFSIYSIHAALHQYSEKAKRIPAATITLEDAELLSRLHKKGKKVTVRLLLDNTDSTSTIGVQNLLGDFDGRESPDQVVLVSGGMDSFDIGQGAVDGLGAILTYEVARIFDEMKLYPRRTVRAALWAGSKFGNLGVQKYLDNHENDLGKKYSAALGANLGCLKAKGFIFSGSAQAACIVYEILRLFESPTLSTNLIHVNGTVSDVSWFSNPFVGISNSPAGVPSMTLNGDDGHLYWYADSNGDTVSVLNPNELDVCLGLYAGITYVLADLAEILPR